MTSADLALFEKHWQTYKKIIDGNYMFHREIYTCLESFLSDYFGKQSIAMLDLGCGDASAISKAMSGTKIDYYCGYDLSDLALEAAKNNIQPLVSHYDLVCLDMLAGVSGRNSQFDVVVCSFALHHLDSDSKIALFKSAFSALKANGVLVLVDIFRDDTECLQDFYTNYLGVVRKHWLALNAAEVDDVCTHVQSSDYPETHFAICGYLLEAGFTKNTRLATHEWHQLLVSHKVCH